MYVCNVPMSDGRLSWAMWPVTYRDGLPPTDCHHLSTNPAVYGHESNLQPVDRKSDALTAILPSHLIWQQLVCLIIESAWHATGGHRSTAGCSGEPGTQVLPRQARLCRQSSRNYGRDISSFESWSVSSAVARIDNRTITSVNLFIPRKVTDWSESYA